jgi:hypothetical protein
MLPSRSDVNVNDFAQIRKMDSVLLTSALRESPLNHPFLAFQLDV